MLSRRTFCILLPTAALSLKPAAAAAQPIAEPVADDTWSFATPPNEARPYALWMWMGSNVSVTGITADLEAMKEAGLGGATIFSLADSTTPWAGFIGKSPTPQVVTFTEPWWQLVRHAASECRRLGLELILHNCAGYESSGGPWITAELSMQEVIWSETKAAGGTSLDLSLPRATVDPHPHAQFPQVYLPELGRIGIPVVEARKTYYRDIAVIALPAEGTAGKGQILDLSEHMNEAGDLRWEAPPGDWSIYRFGHTTTGAMIQPAQWEATGLECDKMSAEAVAFHVSHVITEMQKHLGDLAGGQSGTGLTTIYFDSYEAGTPTWTPKMREQFRSRRGYDLTSWLPALAGRTLLSQTETAKFHADFTRTIHDLYRDCYWATPGPLAHQAGLKFVAEPYSGPWEVAEVVKFIDIPAGEFWTRGDKYSPVEVASVAKAAHLLQSKTIAAESFTGSPRESMWSETPAWLKSIGDAALCDGINRMMLHHFVQQPWDARYKPGNAMGQWGTHFGRNQTWWEPGKAWIEYLWRCQNLLQRGDFVAPSRQTSIGVSAVAPDGEQQPLLFRSIRKNIEGASVFFIANTDRSPRTVRLSVPVAGQQPELWDPVWATRRDLPDFEQSAAATSLTLEFAASQSFFLVFRKPVSPSRSNKPASNLPQFIQIATLDASWDVQFDPVWGGPASITFPTLSDWTLHHNPGIRYYSGTALYRYTLKLKASDLMESLWLDLGICHHLATVTVNGRRQGVVWTAPWRIDIGHALQTGDNRIEIAVTNVWANRLIGDEQQPPDCLWNGGCMKEFPDWFLHNQPRPSAGRYTFTTWNYFQKSSPLTPSGLLGPVTLQMKG